MFRFRLKDSVFAAEKDIADRTAKKQIDDRSSLHLTRAVAFSHRVGSCDDHYGGCAVAWRSGEAGRSTAERGQETWKGSDGRLDSCDGSAFARRPRSGCAGACIDRGENS